MRKRTKLGLGATLGLGLIPIFGVGLASAHSDTATLVVNCPAPGANPEWGAVGTEKVHNDYALPETFYVQSAPGFFPETTISITASGSAPFSQCFPVGASGTDTIVGYAVWSDGFRQNNITASAPIPTGCVVTPPTTVPPTTVPPPTTTVPPVSPPVTTPPPGNNVVPGGTLTVAPPAPLVPTPASVTG